MARVDVADTKGFFKDDRIDTAGGGAYERELSAGSSPNKTTFREEDSTLETVNLQTPKGLKAGLQIKHGTRGTEISRVEYDARHQAQLYLINREFNTPTAEKRNGRLDGRVYRQGEWQDKTVHDVIEFVVAQTGGTLAYDGSAPKEFAGPITFTNTPAPQAIDQVLQQEGNNLWTLLEDGKTVTVVNRAPGGKAVGEVGVNVMEQSLTGADVKTDRPAKVTDRDRRGLKTQHGGPAWVGRDQPKGETFGASDPLELEVDLSDLARAAGGAGKISEAYKFTRHVEDGQAGWHFPRDEKNQPIKAQIRLVQKGVMRPDGVVRRKQGEPGFVGAKGFAPKLLTHPNLGMAFEAKVAGAPIFYKKQIVLASKIAAVRKTYQDAINRANGRVTKDISESPTLRKAILATVESNTFQRKADDGTVADHVAIAIVALFDPEWVFINGHVDLDAGELVIDAGNASQFHNLVSAISFGAGQAVEIGWTFNPAHGSNAGPSNPIPLVKVRFAEAIREARFRAHVVTVEEFGPQISPDAGKAPFGVVESGDYEKHNVIENAAKVAGFLEPLDKPRDDTARMKRRAENLARSLELPAMARGSITIFPGDETLKIGQPANGGVIVKIKHTFVPFFKSQFWLEGTPDIDSFERKHWRKKIGEFEGLTQVNSAQILQQRSRTDSTGQGSAATKVPPHNHTDDLTGGTTLGDIEVSSLTIFGTTPDGQPALHATRGGKGATIDLKEVVGLGRLVSGDLLVKVTQVLEDGSIKARVHDDPKMPEIQRVLVLVNGRIIPGEDAAKLVEVGDIRPIMFVENPDPTKPPDAAIVIDETRLVCDHFHEDEERKNESSLVFGVKDDKEDLDKDFAGDLDDLFIVEKRQLSGGAGTELPLKVIGDVRLQHYMAELTGRNGKKAGAAGDERMGFVTGPHKDSADRKDHKSGHLADFLRYWRSPRHENMVGVRTDAVFVSDDEKGKKDNLEDEGSLDFATLHTDLPKITKGIKGAPLVFDHLDWTGPTGKKRGKRWKTILIADHVHPHHQKVPTERCRNESTHVWEGDLSDFGDLDDILTVHRNRLRLFMKNHDPCKPQTVASLCDPDDRFGLITDRRAWADLADVLEYHNPTGSTMLDLKASTHFKLTKITGVSELDGPLPFVGPAQFQPVLFRSPTDILYGYLALDKTRPNCGAPGTWFIEMPFEACEVSSIVRELNTLFANDQTIAAILFGNDQALLKCLGNEILRVCKEAADAIKVLKEEVATNRKLIKEAFDAAIKCIADTARDLTDQDKQIAASSTAADAALAAAISACACCFPEAPPTTFFVVGTTCAGPFIPPLKPVKDPVCVLPECELFQPKLDEPCGKKGIKLE